MFLITTADENTWSFDKPVLFLGRWCLLSSRKHIWSKLDYKVVPYHWSDSRKMQGDVKTVEVLYEKLLIELMELLNNHHNINWSLRAWRILIGPWLCRYIEVFYDRWLSIQYAIKNYNIIGGSYNEKNWEDMVASNFDNFSDLVKTDNWNYHIYSHLLKYNHVKLYNKHPSFENMN